MHQEFTLLRSRIGTLYASARALNVVIDRGAPLDIEGIERGDEEKK